MIDEVVRDDFGHPKITANAAAAISSQVTGNSTSKFEANNNTGRQWFTFSVSKESREKLLTFALIASTLMLLWCWYTIDQFKAETRLKEYDLAKFESEQFAPLVSKVDARYDEQGRLIQTLLDGQINGRCNNQTSRGNQTSSH